MEGTTLHYKAVVTDLDGTLLNQQSMITPKTIDILNALTNQGIELIFATGRHPRDAENFAKKLSFPISIVGLNGALCYHQDKMRANHQLGVTEVTAIAAIAKQHNAHFNAFDEHGWMLFESNSMADEHVRTSSFDYQIISPQHLPTLKINKILLWQPNGIAELAQKIKLRFGNQCEYFCTSPQQLEIGPAKVTKASAVAKLLAMKNISLQSQTIAFGDGENDVELLRQAARGVVMSNAAEEIRCMLNTHPTALCHNEDGVADYLQQLFNL